jgi:hypothetical protein
MNQSEPKSEAALGKWDTPALASTMKSGGRENDEGYRRPNELTGYA